MKKLYCPQNGCSKPNGASRSVSIICSKCGTDYNSFIKLCPRCYNCCSCGRIGKKHFQRNLK